MLNATGIADEGPISYRLEQDLALVTIENGRASLFSVDVLDSLSAGIDRALRERARAVLLRATGPNFSGGADVKRFKGVSAAEARSRLTSRLPLLAELEELPIPTVCAVHGLCLAAGLEIALACDLVIAGESAKFGQLEALLGTTTLLGGTQRLVERAGSARAREIIFTAGIYRAEQFERWNIINQVVADDQLHAKSLALARTLASGPTQAYAATKRLVRAAIDVAIRPADQVLLEVAPPLFETEDMREAVDVVLEQGARALRERVAFRGR